MVIPVTNDRFTRVAAVETQPDDSARLEAREQRFQSLAGFKHVVAPLGTALTANQLTLLWRLAPEPTLCLDGDAAGRLVARRSTQR